MENSREKHAIYRASMPNCACWHCDLDHGLGMDAVMGQTLLSTQMRTLCVRERERERKTAILFFPVVNGIPECPDFGCR